MARSTPASDALGLSDSQALLTALLRSDSEEEVVQILNARGLWHDPALWRDYADDEQNFSTAGNQQRNPEAALVEKVINSVDASLMRRCLGRGIDPRGNEAPASIREAIAIFFEDADPTAIRDYQGYIAEWSTQRRTEVAREITLAITGPRAEEGEAPCITIADAGEGQTPESIPETILSLNKGIKKAIPFVQGKFNMGGTGALRFCGKRNLQLVLSKRHPAIALAEGASSRWGFTIVRRDYPNDDSRVSVYRYLAPVGALKRPTHGELLTVAQPTLPIFPEGQHPYSREAEWGTLVKLYQYDTRFKTHLFRRGGLQERLDLFMPGLALPVRLHECRPYRGSAGSFETTLSGLQVRLAASQNLDFEPDTGEIVIEGEPIATTLYAFKRDAAPTYRKNEGVLFVVNGQSHATLQADRFFRRAQMGYLKDSLLVLLDCSALRDGTKEDLFLNSRDRLADQDLARKIEDELVEIISRHEGLRQLRERRRQEDTASKISNDKPFEDALRSILRRHPTLSKLFLTGTRLSNPFSEVEVAIGQRFRGSPHPTFFKFKEHPYGQRLVRRCHLGQRLRLTFETDVVNDYFRRRTNAGRLTLLTKLNDHTVAVDHNLNLHNGLAHLNLDLPPEARAGDIFRVHAEVSDPTLVQPFTNVATVTVGPAQDRQGGGTRRRKSRDDPEEDGRKERRPSGIAFPNVTEVYRDKWPSRKMNEHSALRIEQAGEAEDKSGTPVWDFYVNMDNIYLQSELKASRQEPDLLRAKFKFGMALIGIGFLSDTSARTRHEDDRPSQFSNRPDQEDLVAIATDALAPVLLPMIGALGDLEINELEDAVETTNANGDL